MLCRTPHRPTCASSAARSSRSLVAARCCLPAPSSCLGQRSSSSPLAARRRLPAAPRTQRRQSGTRASVFQVERQAEVSGRSVAAACARVRQRRGRSLGAHHLAATGRPLRHPFLRARRRRSRASCLSRSSSSLPSWKCEPAGRALGDQKWRKAPGDKQQAAAASCTLSCMRVLHCGPWGSTQQVAVAGGAPRRPRGVPGAAQRRGDQSDLRAAARRHADGGRGPAAAGPLHGRPGEWPRSQRPSGCATWRTRAATSLAPSGFARLHRPIACTCAGRFDCRVQQPVDCGGPGGHAAGRRHGGARLLLAARGERLHRRPRAVRRAGAARRAGAQGARAAPGQGEARPPALLLTRPACTHPAPTSAHRAHRVPPWGPQYIEMEECILCCGSKDTTYVPGS